MNGRQSCWFLLVTLALHTVRGAPSPNDNSVAIPIPELSPINQALNIEANQVSVVEPETSRDKRLALITKTGVKALLLNFIFGKIDGALDSKIRLINQLDKQNVIKNQQYLGIAPPQSAAYNAGRPPRPVYGVPSPPPRTTTPKVSTPAPVEFSTASPVSLVIPDQLYGNSFGLVTNISQTIGDVLFNTAGRAQEFANTLSAQTRRTFGFGLGPTSKKRSENSS